MPIVYISAVSDNAWLLSEDEINRLSYDLGGIAHVVVEPSRVFSLRLSEACGRRNVYNGAIAISVPKSGFIRRFASNTRSGSSRDISGAIRSSCLRLRSFMPSTCWNWTDLQEYALQSQRAALRGGLSAEAADQLFADYSKQLADQQSEIRSLKEQVRSQNVADMEREETVVTSKSVFDNLMKEIYEEEIVDRIRLAVQAALDNAELTGMDSRTVAVWHKIVQQVPRSRAVDLLLADLERATKDPKRAGDELTNLLQRHGYRNKSEKRHIRMEPEDGFDGLHNLTISKTPSENRGLKNLRKQIERTMGIHNIPSEARTS